MPAQRRDRNNRVKETRKVSETVLSGVRVIAIDQNTDDLKGKPKLGKTVTVEVTPKQAEFVTLATRMGRLHLSLHSLGKKGEPQTEPTYEIGDRKPKEDRGGGRGGRGGGRGGRGRRDRGDRGDRKERKEREDRD